MAARVIENTFEVLSVHTLAVVEAIDCLDKAGKLSAKAQELYKGVRSVSTKIDADVPSFKKLKSIKEYLKANNPEVI